VEILLKPINLWSIFAQTFSMRRLLFVLLIIGISAVVWFVVFRKKDNKEEGPKQQPIAQSKYSPAFNQSVSNAMDGYYTLSEALVAWDSTKVDTLASSLNKILDSIQWNELSKDTSGIATTAKSSVDNAKNDIQTLLAAKGLEAKRRGYQSLSNNLYDFLRVVQYDGEKVYLQECPMAFNDDETAQWLSDKPQIRNPYLGLYHPKYGKGMLVCGETKDSLNYAQK
jgi:hypothetical protein